MPAGVAHWEILLCTQTFRCHGNSTSRQPSKLSHACAALLLDTAGAAHWEILLRARAVECQCYVIAAAQAGVHNSKRESYGHSLIIDPWGTVIARLEDPQQTGIAVADIDLDKLDAVRQKMPIQQHRAKGRELLKGQLG
eukprot:GHUV01021944.1.p1 GENE.GHUV01021944.1~~GHUV01021944.1.p1  ORF type:complete len:139 (+),score=34.46 GHUV01021944.1:322-738(+)